MKKTLHGLCVITFAGAMFGMGRASAQSYTFTNLGTLGGTNSSALAINNAGQIVGSAQTAVNALHGAMWRGTTVTDMSTLGIFSNANNNLGQIAGNGISPSTGNSVASVWNGSTVTNLTTLGGYASDGYAINNSGQVAGVSYITGNANRHATLWNGAVATDLGTLGGTESSALAINNSGQVAGWATTESGTHLATVWNGTTAIGLDTLGGTNGMAFGINFAGLVVGYSMTIRNDASHATLWNGTSATDLGTLGGLNSYALGINSSGLVVGWAQTPGGRNDAPHAALWNGTTATDLNTFLDASTVTAGWVLDTAYGVNDQGSIVGVARNSVTGQQNAFLLAAVPEPETSAMLLTGLGLIGAVARRRRAADALKAEPRALSLRS